MVILTKVKMNVASSYAHARCIAGGCKYQILTIPPQSIPVQLPKATTSDTFLGGESAGLRSAAPDGLHFPNPHWGWGSGREFCGSIYSAPSRDDFLFLRGTARYSTKQPCTSKTDFAVRSRASKVSLV